MHFTYLIFLGLAIDFEKRKIFLILIIYSIIIIKITKNILLLQIHKISEILCDTRKNKHSFKNVLKINNYELINCLKFEFT